MYISKKASFLFFLSFFFLLLGRSPLKHTRTLKTSVIIPCYYRHAQHLYSLLHLFQNQTVLPDEIIISISECEKIDPFILYTLEKKPWIFPVNIITSNKVQHAGENRNIACSNATGDIFICHDADDIPHPQRIEIIKYFFEHYDIDHLLHQYFFIHSEKTEVNFDMVVKDFTSIQFARLYKNGEDYINNHRDRLHNGHVSISKQLFDTIKWTNKRRKQDAEFNRKVFKLFTNQVLLIKVPLVGYRIFLSSKNRA